MTDDASRREGREVLERSEVTDDATRREGREVLEESEVTDDASRREGREALERKERLQAQGQRLESLGQLAGGVAHDFNNLLAVILNYVSFVSEEVAAAAAVAGPDPALHLEAASADLAQIKKAAERAAGLTHQLLVFARRDVIRPQVLDLDTVITSVEEMLRRTIGEHVELVTSLAGDLWPVLADPGQLEQVLVNLAVNARDAMPAGGTLTIDTGNITVDADTIAGGSRARKGRNVRLRVSDTGTGMPSEVAQHAFEPFFTTKPRRRRNRARPGHRLRDPHPGRREHPDLLRARHRHDLHHYAARHRRGSRPDCRARALPADAQGRDRPDR